MSENDVCLLIAEDEEAIRNSIANFVKKQADFIDTVYTAGSGQEALDKILCHRPQLMLLDIQMPIKDGIEVLEEATSANLCPKTIIVSGHDDFSYAQKAIRYGVIDYLLKPCRSSEILEKMRLIVNREFSAVQETGSAGKEKRNNGNYLVDAALKYIQEHYPEDITLPLVAKKIGITPGYLSTLFNRTLNCKFVDYLNKIRIDHACSYFYDSRLKTYEVAFKVGFNDEKYFSHVFKRITGKSPSEYRKSMIDHDY